MSQSVRTYLLGVVSAAMLAALVQTLVPKGAVRRVCTLACGVVLVLVTLSPLRALDEAVLSRAISRLELEQGSEGVDVEVRTNDQIAALIKQKSEAYILDKAASLGLTLRVEVTVETAGAYPYPSAVRLSGHADAASRRSLGALIEENLAIPAASQEWVLQ